MSYADREYIHGATTPQAVFDRVKERHGTPTGAQLRAWVNTVLGPWHIEPSVFAGCKKEQS